MSRKWIALLLLILLLVILPGYFILSDYFGNQSNAQGNTNPPHPTEGPEHPPLVVPENPFGTIGLTAALIAALAIFALMKKHPFKQTKI